MRLATQWADPKQKMYAVKSIRKDQVEYVGMLEQELLVLMEVDHPNIVRFYEVYSDPKYYRIVMEYLEGGELFDSITTRGAFPEPQAALITKQLLSAIKHLHSLNIVHRDLKPENVILVNKETCRVKLIDFGLSRMLAEGTSVMKTRLGTPYFVSPEILGGKYDKRCDLWSLGVMTFMLVCGYPPFNGHTDAEVFYKIKLCDYIFPAVSELAQDFISRLLRTNPDLRLTIQEALRHPWLPA